LNLGDDHAVVPCLDGQPKSDAAESLNLDQL
jgi:hypothetical protein